MLAFGEKARLHALEKLLENVDPFLISRGFVRSSQFEWVRDGGWKKEEFDLNSKELWILPTVRVLLRRAHRLPDGADFDYIAQRNIGRILHPEAGPDFDIKVPSISFRISSFVRKTMQEIRDGLPWFEQFATAELCLENLDKYLKPGCPSSIDAKEFLEKLRKANNDKS